MLTPFFVWNPCGIPPSIPPLPDHRHRSRALFTNPGRRTTLSDSTSFVPKQGRRFIATSGKRWRRRRWTPRSSVRGGRRQRRRPGWSRSSRWRLGGRIWEAGEEVCAGIGPCGCRRGMQAENVAVLEILSRTPALMRQSVHAFLWGRMKAYSAKTTLLFCILKTQFWGGRVPWPHSMFTCSCVEASKPNRHRQRAR